MERQRFAGRRRHEKSCSLSASRFSTLKNVHKIVYFLREKKVPLHSMNCNFCHFYMISLNKNGLIVDHDEDLWTFIRIVTRNMLFMQKCPQSSQKMSTSNACMLATFFMSAVGAESYFSVPLQPSLENCNFLSPKQSNIFLAIYLMAFFPSKVQY